MAIAPAASSAESDQPAPVASAVPPKTPSDTVHVGKTVTLDDSQWRIIEARDAGQSVKPNRGDYDDKRTTGRFVMVHYKVINLEKKEEMMLDRPKIQDERGREFGVIDMEGYYVPTHTKAAGLDILQPGVPREYWTVVEVPSDAVHLKIAVHGFSLLGKIELVDLGL